MADARREAMAERMAKLKARTQLIEARKGDRLSSTMDTLGGNAAFSQPVAEPAAGGGLAAGPGGAGVSPAGAVAPPAQQPSLGGPPNPLSVSGTAGTPADRGRSDTPASLPTTPGTAPQTCRIAVQSMNELCTACTSNFMYEYLVN
jgi:hypothetical protein